MSTKPSFCLTDASLVLLIALCGTILHILLNGQYGFHRDELDIIMNARQLDWGYVAYPPLTPSVARLGLELFGNSLQGLRLFSAIGQGAVMFLTGFMAHDLGGKRPAQVMAALAVYIAPVALTAGTLIQYMAFDYVWWVMIAFFTVRLLKTDDARYWLGIGAGIGLGMLTKFTLAFWVAGLVIAVLLTPARRYLRSPWLWAGAGLALLLYAPNLLWQIQHSFVSLEFLNAIHARDISWGRTTAFWPEQLYVSTNPFTFPLWVAGLIWCLFSPPGKRFRALGLMFLTTLALLALNRGRAYYVGPA
jgi:4-amino-4-deoxy-L-arabinose transferase-like glycosyltransferase